MKLLVTAPMLQESLDELKRYFEEIHYYPWTLKEDGNGYSEKEISALLEEYQPDALISELDELTRVVLTGYGRLKVIGDCRANPANIDLNACNELGIPVLCTPARNAQAVAELLVGMLINFFRNVQPAIRWVEEGNWVPGNMPYSTFMGNELQGKKVGFVGFGAVGQTTAGILHGFGCEISFYDPYVDSVKETFFKKELEEIFRESDIVSVHLPVLESTKGMIDGRLIGMMKPTSVFANSARSAVVVTEALVDALEHNRIRGAVLDVLDHEPPTEEDLKIAKLPNVLLTPHIAGASREVFQHQSHIITERFVQWMKKENMDKIIYNTEVRKRL